MDADLGTSSLQKLAPNMLLDPRSAVLLWPSIRPKPWIDKVRGPMYADLRIETTGKLSYCLNLPDFRNALRLVNTMMRAIRGPDYKPGAPSKYIELPLSGGITIHPGCITGMLLWESVTPQETQLIKRWMLRIETRGRNILEVPYENEIHAYRVLGILEKMSRGRAEVKLKPKLNELDAPSDAGLATLSAA